MAIKRNQATARKPRLTRWLSTPVERSKRIMDLRRQRTVRRLLALEMLEDRRLLTDNQPPYFTFGPSDLIGNNLEKVPNFAGNGELQLNGVWPRAHKLKAGRVAVTSTGTASEGSWYYSIDIIRQDGSPDLSVGTNGRISIDVAPSSADGARGLYELSNGCLIVAGVTNYGGGADNWGMVKLRPDGTLDLTFGDNGKVIYDVPSFGMADSVTELSDGKLIVAGRVANSRQLGLLRLQANGAVDTTFGSNGLLVISLGNGDNNSVGYSKVIKSSSGAFFVKTGREYQAAAPRQSILLKINSFGEIVKDYRFGLGSEVRSDDVIVDSTGRMLVVGSVDQDVFVLRYTSEGDLDPSFSDGGILRAPATAFFGSATGIANLSDGFTYISYLSDDAKQVVIRRITEYGDFDDSFGSQGQFKYNYGERVGGDHAWLDLLGLENGTIWLGSPNLEWNSRIVQLRINSKSIPEDSETQVVILNNIDPGLGESQTLRVTASSSNNSLIPTPTVTYTSPNATGSIAFTPVANQSGTAVITVTVEDAGLDNDLATIADNVTFSRSFSVTVTPVNDPPTLDPLGGLGEPQRFDSISQPESIDSGDIDGDGDIDMIVFNRASGAFIDIYKNDGKGNFARTGRMAADPGEPHSLGIRLNDFDNDGDLDLLLHFNGNGGQFKVLTNNGSGTFSYTSTVVSMGSITPAALYAFDFNRDGLTDFASPNYNGNSFSVVLRQASNTFQGATVYSLTSQAASNPTRLFIDDIDRDGFADVLVPTQAGGNVVIYHGVGDGTFHRKRILDAGFRVETSSYLDVDGDGDKDLVQAESQNKIHLWRNNGYGDFTLESQWIVMPNTTFYGLFSADIAGNAEPELLVATSTSLRYVSDLNGSRSITTLNSDRYIGIVTGDWNRDGMNDLAAISLHDHKFAVVNSQLARYIIGTDGGELRVPLKGITAGPLENQPLRVKATSDVPELFSVLTVSLDGTGPLGEVYLKSAPGATGSAVITVEVEDGGSDNDLNTVWDNATVSRKFLVDLVQFNFIENGSTLSLRITDPNQQLDIKATASGYQLTLSSGQWRGLNSERVSGHGTNTLSISALGQTALDRIEIDDDASNTWVQFQDSGSYPFTESMIIRLDQQDAGNIFFRGRTQFIGSASLSGSTTRGIEMSGSTSKLSTVDGDLFLSANRQSIPHSDLFVGIDVRQATMEVTGNGNVTLLGRAGGNTDDTSHWFGIAIHQGAQVIGGRNQTSLRLDGVGGSGAGNDNSGIAINGFGQDGQPTQVISRGGDIEINGLAQAANGSLWSRGVRIRDGAQVGIVREPEFGSSTAGKITVHGVSATTRGDHFGVHLEGVGTRVYSAGGLVSIIGVGSGEAFYHGNSGIVIQNGATIGSSTLSQPIRLVGSSDESAYGLRLTNSASSILGGPQGIVTIESGTRVYFESAIQDVGASTLQFSNLTPLYFRIDGVVPDVDLNQLDVQGLVNLSGSQLRLAGNHLFRSSDPVVLIDNDGDDAVVGQFQNLPEGSLISFNQVTLQLSYRGGTGNDVTLTPVNRLPELDFIQSVSISEDAASQSLSLDGIRAGGGENQPLRVYAISDRPELIPTPTVQYQSANTSGTLQYRPVADRFGKAIVTVFVEDGGLDLKLETAADNGIASRAFEITVQPVNDSPNFDSIADRTITEDSPEQTILLSAIHAGTFESQPLSITVVSSSPQLTGSPVVDYVSPNSQGAIRFTPLPDQNGEAILQVTVTDGGLDNDLATAADNLATVKQFRVKVLPVADAPEALNGHAEVDANQIFDASLEEMLLLARDADLPNDVLDLVASSYSSSLGGQVNVIPQQGIRFDATSVLAVKRLKPQETLVDSLVYQFRDSLGAVSNTGTLQITVEGVNDPPVAMNDQYRLSIASSSLLDVIFNDYDYDENLDRNSLEIVTQPRGGTVHVKDGKFEFTPNQTVLGDDTFTYRVRDTDGLYSLISEVTLGLYEVPGSVEDFDSTKRDQTKTIDVLANDTFLVSELDRDTLQIVTGPDSGVATISNGKIVYTPAQAFLGEVQLTYQVRNRLGEISAPAWVKIKVEGSRFQNSASRYDVNVDNYINAMDVLVIINTLRANGPRAVSEISGEPIFFFDVNGDYFINAMDALIVINYLKYRVPQGEGEGEGEGQFDADLTAESSVVKDYEITSGLVDFDWEQEKRRRNRNLHS